jgi:hypothetical protein
MRGRGKLAPATRSEKSIVSILPIDVADRSAFPSERQACPQPIALRAPRRRAHAGLDMVTVRTDRNAWEAGFPPPP